MKIALTTDSFVEGQGGVSTAVSALARNLRQRGHEVVVYTAADPSHKHSDLDIVGLRALRYERFPGGRAPMVPISLVQELVVLEAMASGLPRPSPGQRWRKTFRCAYRLSVCSCEFDARYFCGSFSKER